jgi:hypothetical protein
VRGNEILRIVSITHKDSPRGYNSSSAEIAAQARQGDCRSTEASRLLLMANEDQPLTVDVVVPPELQVGAYANLAAVSSQSPHDITLDFIQLVPGGGMPQPIVVARLKLSPSFLMPLMQILSSHLAQHEALQEAENNPPQPPPAREES